MPIPPTPRRLLLIAALAFVPVLPYLFLGYAGQDLPFHVCSWLDLRDGWLSGRLNPGWSAAANYGLGDPHLTFYPPVSYFLGAFLTLVLPLQLAPAAFAWIALALSGLAMYAASKPFVAERDRITAALLYMLGPYTVTTSLVRFAAAELLVQAWLPLVALCYYQAVWIPAVWIPSAQIPSAQIPSAQIPAAQTPAAQIPAARTPAGYKRDRRSGRRALILLALLLGLSWLTNIPASIVLLYSLATAAALRAVLERSVVPVLRILAAEALAAAFAAFHLLPVWNERSWIHADALLRIDPLQLLLFMPHNTFPDRPILVVCWIFLCVQAALAAACLRRRALLLSASSAVALWASLAAASSLLQSPLAIPLWRHAPELAFVQFPFRFLSILGVALPLLLLTPGTRPSLRRSAYAWTAILSIAPFLGYLSEQAVAANRAPPLAALLASRRHIGAPEYLPAATLMPVAPPAMPDVAAVDPSNPALADRACRAAMLRQSPDLRIVQTSSANPCRLRLKTYFYPYWRASDESGLAMPTSREVTGLLAVDVPAGSHTVTIVFHPASPIRTAGALISAITLTLALLSLLLFRQPRYPATLRHPARHLP